MIFEAPVADAPGVADLVPPATAQTAVDRYRAGVATLVWRISDAVPKGGRVV